MFEVESRQPSTVNDACNTGYPLLTAARVRIASVAKPIRVETGLRGIKGQGIVVTRVPIDIALRWIEQPG